LVADGSKFVQHTVRPKGLKTGLRQSELEGATIQFQSPPAQDRGWCRQGLQHRGGVVSKPQADIKNAQRFAGSKTAQLGGFNEFGSCLVERSSGVVKGFTEALAVETEASIGSRKSLEFP
jgi:hypothetical protein